MKDIATPYEIPEKPSMVQGTIGLEYDPQDLVEMAKVINDNAIVLDQLFKKMSMIEQRLGMGGEIDDSMEFDPGTRTV